MKLDRAKSKYSGGRRSRAVLLFLVGMVAGGGLALTLGARLELQAAGAEPYHYKAARQAPAELQYFDRMPALTVAGTPDEMGQQIGALSGDGMKSLMGHQEEFIRGLRLPLAGPMIVQAGQAMLPRFPLDQRRELEAMAKAADMATDPLVSANVMYEYSRLRGCSVLMIEPGRSATGGPLFGRNFDFPTFGFLDRYSLVIVYRGKGKHAFASVTFPGLIGCISAMNDAGLCLAELEVNQSRDGAPRFDPAGVPIEMCFRRIMEECKTVDEAEKLLQGEKRSSMCNLAICDLHDAAVLEITPKTVARRPAEDGLCSCTNYFRTPQLTTGQSSRRFDTLETCRSLATVSLAEVAKKLDAVNQGPLTVQTMVFEPATLTLHLSLGPRPASSHPLKAIDLKPLFKDPPAR